MVPAKSTFFFSFQNFFSKKNVTSLKSSEIWGRGSKAISEGVSGNETLKARGGG